MKQTNDNWTNVTEYYGSMLNEKQSERASSSRVEVTSWASADHSVYFNQQESLPRLSSSVPSEQAVGSEHFLHRYHGCLSILQMKC